MFNWISRCFLKKIISKALVAAHLVKEFIKFLYYNVIKELLNKFHDLYVRIKTGISAKKRDIIIFIIKLALKNGDYNVITGVFDKSQDKILDGRDMTANDADRDVKNLKEGLNIAQS